MPSPMAANSSIKAGADFDSSGWPVRRMMMNAPRAQDTAMVTPISLE